VQKWLKEIDFSGAPNINPNQGEPPNCPSKIDASVCYWTCQGCAADDVVTCPSSNVWGLTFDDGPTDATPRLLEFLLQQNVKATFFLIGGNVIQYPEVVRTEITHGHHLASHTWSHHALTTLSNEQIVAEMKWTEKAIEDATGYRVKYIRPPYGDIDNRVRFVLKKLGYIVVDWTSDAFDTNDWKIPLKQATTSSVIIKFKQSVDNYNNNTKTTTTRTNLRKGFISLEHDLSTDTVTVAKSIIPYAVSHSLIIQSVATCLRDDKPYSAINGLRTNNSLPANGMNPVGQGSPNATRTVTAGSSRFNVLGHHFLGLVLITFYGIWW
ncbi:chitin deacetylase, partial [Modicella reniformis]